MSVGVLFEDEIEIPPGMEGFESFRAWARSDVFPEWGRIDYVDGRIEVEARPEDPFLHGTPKAEVLRVIANRVKSLELGHVFVSRTRFSTPRTALSVEPDVVVLTHQSISGGKVQPVPSGWRHAREIEGAPDLVVEVVSEVSMSKDTVRLFRAYHAAGVREYWLVDVQKEPVRFEIWHAGPEAFRSSPISADGYQQSEVLTAAFLLQWTRRADGQVQYDLLEKSGSF